MHLSVAEAKNRSTLQLLTGVHLVAAKSWGTTTRRLLILLHLVQTGVIGGPAGHPQAEAVLKTDIILSHVNYRTFLLYVQRWFIHYAYLHDITPLELTRSNALTLSRNICIASWDDSQTFLLILGSVFGSNGLKRAGASIREQGHQKTEI
jgi:hypothetical protein